MGREFEVTRAGVHVTKSVTLDTFNHAIVELQITSTASDPCEIHIHDPVPPETTPRILSAGEGDWSIEAETALYARALAPDETTTTVYRSQKVTDQVPDIYLQPPTLEVVDRPEEGETTQPAKADDTAPVVRGAGTAVFDFSEPTHGPEQATSPSVTDETGSGEDGWAPSNTPLSNDESVDGFKERENDTRSEAATEASATSPEPDRSTSDDRDDHSIGGDTPKTESDDSGSTEGLADKPTEKGKHGATADDVATAIKHVDDTATADQKEPPRSIEASARDLQSRFQDLVDSIDTLQTCIDELTNGTQTLTSLTTDTEATQEQLQRLDYEQQALRVDLEALTVRVQTLENQESVTENEIEDLRTTLERIQATQHEMEEHVATMTSPPDSSEN